MKTRSLAVAALLASTASAHAVGLDRSGQRIDVLFQDGNHVELSFRIADPEVDGTDFLGANTGNVADTFRYLTGGIKYQFSDKISAALIFDEPFGVNSDYPGSSVLLGGTGAAVDSYAITAVGRYKFNDNWSAHAGLRYQEVSAEVNLGGVAFNDPTAPLGAPSGINGYNALFESDGDVGFLVGFAYEIPEIALRVALTYNSGTTHELRTTESIRSIPIALATGGAVSSPTITEVDTPESLNLTFQSGIAQNTLAFGSIRYARYSQTVVVPAGFDLLVDPGSPGDSLTDLESGFDFELGVGRRFNEKWSGSISIGHSTVGDDDNVSPLLPTNGSTFVSIGARYDVNDKMSISGGIRYTELFGATAAPGGTPAASFSDNSAISGALTIAYKF